MRTPPSGEYYKAFNALRISAASVACVVALGYLAFFLIMGNADLTGTMRHWFEYPAYFTFGGLIALFREVFLAHGRMVLFALMPLAAALFWGAKLEHSAGLLLLPPGLIYLGTRKAGNCQQHDATE